MKRTIALAAVLVLLASLLAPSLSRPQQTSAANETVNVWMTTSDRTRLLQQQAAVTFGPDGAANATTIDVNEAQTYQTMDGFGSSLTDSSAWLMWNRMTAAQRNTVLNQLFNPSTGIGLSFLRQTIGASDFSANGNYNYDNTCCDTNDFSIAHELNYNIPILKEIKAINPNVIFMASSWSAPGWMKTSNSMIGGGLRPEYYGQFAQYILKFVQAYNAQGLPIYAVTPNNEVQFSPPGYPGMLMSEAEQTNFIKNNLGPTLRGAGLSTKIMVLDHNWDIASYPINVMNDATAKSYVAGSAMHCYGGTPDAMSTIHNAHPDRDIWVTECSDGTWIDGGSFSGLFRRDMRDLIIGSTRHWAKSIIHWNLALDQNNGPTNGGCTTCYGTVTINNTNGAVSFNAEYYALGHASKFVKQGAYRIASNTFANGIENVAFKNPDGSKVLIAYNAGGASSTFKVRWGGQAFTYTLPAGAAATFVWSGTIAPRSAFTQIEAETYSGQANTQLETTTDVGGGQNVGFIDEGDWLSYSLDFGSGANSVSMRIASAATFAGTIELRLGSTTGTLLGTLGTSSTGGWQTWETRTASIANVTGVQNLYLVFRGGAGIVNLNWLRFAGSPTPTRTNTVTGPTATRTNTPLPGSCGTANFALGKQASASSTESATYPASAAVDGNTTTRWASAFADPQWITVDLGAVTRICRVQLSWEAAYASAYQLQTSNDNVTWSTIKSVTGENGGIDDHTGLVAQARYLRVNGTTRATVYGYSLWEIGIYIGDAAPTPSRTNTTVAATATRTSTPVGPTATRTSTTSPNTPLSRTGWTATASNVPTDACCTADVPARALDGNATTRWSSGLAQASGQWFRVDMAASRSFSRVVLDAGTSTGDYPRGWQLQTSADNVTWTTVTSGTGTGQLVTITFPTRSARYIRVNLTGAIGNWWSIHELNVYP